MIKEMNYYKKFIVIVGFGVIMSLMTTINMDAATITPEYIADEAFAMCLLETNDETEFDKVNVDMSEEEFTKMAEDVETIECNDESNQITDLSGLEFFTNLKELTITNLSDDIVEIPSVINELTKLEDLDLSQNNIQEISNIDNLKDLRTLQLYSNDIEKIEGLDKLENLTALALYDTDIQKIEGLDNLKNLEYLDISSSGISKIENLDSLVKLTDLNLGGNYITKIEGLNELDKLEVLFLAANDIVDLTSLSDLPDSLITVNLDSQNSEYYIPFDTSYEEYFGLTNFGDNLDSSQVLLDGGDYESTIDNSEQSYETAYDITLKDSNKFELVPDSVTNFSYSLEVEIFAYDPLSASNADTSLLYAAKTEDLLKQQLSVYAGGLYGQDVTGLVEITGLGGYNLDNPEVGTYEIEVALEDYLLMDIIGDQSLTVSYTVHDITSLLTSDATINISEAPTSYDEILMMLETKVTEMGQKISGYDVIDAGCVVFSMDTYDMNNPEVGEYNIEVSYTDSNGDEYKSTSMLTVTEDAEIAETGIAYSPYLIGALIIFVIAILAIRIKKNK